jgi:tRNA pseudouridine38-40 synthase
LRNNRRRTIAPAGSPAASEAGAAEELERTVALYKSIVAYDGTRFQGFQRQADGIRTVQSVLEDSLRSMGWQESSLQAAGRTDRGVHARGQVISYALDWAHGEETLTRAFNAHLPDDVAVWGSEQAPQGFHPRFSAVSRCYEYRLAVGRWPDPLRDRFALRVWPEPDREAMESLAQAFVGRMDFGAFGQAPIEGGHTVRQVMACGWRAVDDEWVFNIEADAFLKHMVRRLVAACLMVGNGELDAEAVTGLLGHPEKRWEGRLAEPHGLTLMRVRYDGGPAVAITSDDE